MELDFYADETVGSAKTLTTDTWHAVVRLCPDLRVVILVHGLSNFNNCTTFLVKGMPLSEVSQNGLRHKYCEQTNKLEGYTCQ